jgi:hypothetical protein
LEIGVNIVAASWTLGPAALIGNTDILRHALQFGALNVGFDGLAQTAAILDGRQTEYNWLQGANSFAQGVYLSSGMAIPGVRQVLTGYFTSESVHGAAEAWRNGDSYTALVHGLGAVVGGLDLAGSARSAWSATRSTISDAWSSGPRGNVRMFDPFGAALGEGSARARGGVEPRRAPDSAGAYRSDPAPAPMDFGPNWAEGSPRGRAFEVSWAMDSAPRARPFEGIMDSGVRPGEASGPRIFDESALSNRPMQRGEGMAEPARGLPDQTRYGEQRTRRPGEFDPRDVHRQGLYDADPATNARMQAEVEGRLRDMGFTPEEARSVAEQGGRQGTNGKAILDAINSGEIAEWRVRSGNQGAIANLLDRVGVKIDGEATISRSRYPETAKHVADAQKAGHPDVLEIDRPNADSRRSDSLAGHQKVSGMQLDEYPPAMFKEGGTGASVRAISPEDNMGAGASMGNQLRRFPNGARIRIRVVK